MKKLILIALCLMAVSAFGQVDTTFKRHNDSITRAMQSAYINSDTHKAFLKRERDNEIKDSTKKKEDEILARNRDKERTKQLAVEKSASDKIDKENADDVKKVIKKYGKAAYDKAIKGHIWLGMGKDLCFYAVQDQMDEHYSYTKAGTIITWTFWNDPGTLTFKNNKLIAITDYVGN